MAYSINKVTIVGNVGKDPEMRHTQDGKLIANFSVATSEQWKDKATGEKRERVEWHRIVVFNEGLAGIIEKHVSKGTQVYIEGMLQTRKWQDKDGSDRYSTEIVLKAFNGELVIFKKGGGGSRDDGDPGPSSDDYAQASGSSARPKSASRGPDSDMDDKIPF